MIMNKYFTLLLVLLIVSCAKDDRPTVATIHENWEFKEQTDSVWNSASVPGNVYSDLLTHKKIPDPFFGANELSVQWVPTKDWEYQTTFSLDEETLQKSNIELTFEGLDTYASIYLNDSLIGKTDNAFRTWKFPIKKLAKAENSLRIGFQSTSVHEDKETEKLDYLLNPGIRVFTRKAQFQYGWDWGPIINTSGIWKPIKITSWNNLKLDDVYFKQESLTDSLASVSVEYTVTSNEDIEDTSFEIKYDQTTHTVKSPIYKDTHTYSTRLRIKNPKRWWTFNLGDPHLYEFDVTLREGNNIKGREKVKVGLRTIELIRNKDKAGETFYFELNGVPVFMKGANYIPQHSMQDKVTDAHYEKLLNDTKNANMNMLRVWGGGIYENDIFYELCDEKGILVWQDFMFACAMYPGDKAFLDNVQQEAIDQVKRLRNYASVALWCGNNENNEAWHNWGWQTDKTEAQRKEVWDSYVTVFNRILPEVVAKYNPSISYWESSPSYGRRDPRSFTEGDNHDWAVWHGGVPFERFEQKIPRFMSEFGFQSFPSYEAIRAFTGEDSITINHDSYITHQKHPRGFKLIREYMGRDYPVPTSGEDYVYMSQLTQAKGITMGMEAERRAMPYCMGSLYWQLNDCWPVVSWSSIDFMGNWKALHYKAKKSFEDVLISPVIENDTLKTYVVSDKLESTKGELRLQFIDFNGHVIADFKESIDIQANTSEAMIWMATEQFKPNHKDMFLKTTLKADNTDFNTTDIFYIARPKDLNLPEENISTKITKIEEGFSIEVSAEALQKDVFFYTKAKGHFSDNFFDVLPNQTVTITFKTAAENIDDLAFKTLNGIQGNIVE
jgi:beta-mannosidase